MPATLAILSIVFVECVFSAVGITNEAATWKHKLLSILVLFIGNGINAISTRVSTQLNNFFVVAKFLNIAALVIAGISVIIIQSKHPEWTKIGGRDWYTKSWFQYRDTVNLDGTKTHWNELGEWELFGHFSTALYGALWAYSGWDKVSYP
jgi:L-type amino acid transporter 9